MFVRFGTTVVVNLLYCYANIMFVLYLSVFPVPMLCSMQITYLSD